MYFFFNGIAGKLLSNIHCFFMPWLSNIQIQSRMDFVDGQILITP